MLLNFRKNRKKYYAFFLLKREGTYTRLRKKRFNPNRTTLSYKKGAYPLDVSKPTYERGLKLFYFIEIGKTQLFFQNDKTSSIISPKVIDMIMSQKIVSQLTQNLSGANKLNIMTLLLGVVMGAMIGFIIAGYV